MTIEEKCDLARAVNYYEEALNLFVEELTYEGISYNGKQAQKFLKIADRGRKIIESIIGPVVPLPPKELPPSADK